MIFDRKIIKFEWDKGNKNKSLQKYGISNNEAEETFFDSDKQEYPDPAHSKKEERKVLVGSTKKGRLLFIVYTKRIKKIRIISARDLNKKKERSLYEEAT